MALLKPFVFSVFLPEALAQLRVILSQRSFAQLSCNNIFVLIHFNIIRGSGLNFLIAHTVERSRLTFCTTSRTSGTTCTASTTRTATGCSGCLLTQSYRTA